MQTRVCKVSRCTHLGVRELEAGHSVLEKWTMLKMGRTERGFEPQWPTLGSMHYLHLGRLADALCPFPTHSLHRSDRRAKRIARLNWVHIPRRRELNERLRLSTCDCERATN